MDDHCRLHMMADALPAFDLLETIRWTPDAGFFLLDRHIRRIERSARHFDYVWSKAGALRELDRAVGGKTEPQRVRLLVSRSGSIRVECAALGPPSALPAKLGIAAAPVDPTNVLLSNKTTCRSMYAEAALPDCDDVILWTAGGDVTETTLGNLVVEMSGRKVTPPLSAGLLAGTFRAELLERGEIVEGRVTLDDVKTAPRVWIINSVREWWPAEIYIANAAPTRPISTSATIPTTANRSQR
jgi:para-aminobenzoate synthetase/4-amino-4-deoxychorismate lyase